jgi:positive regulator of sigma E activity
MGLPLVMLLLAALSVEYLFEQLSIVILFEVLMFVQARSAQEAQAA